MKAGPCCSLRWVTQHHSLTFAIWHGTTLRFGSRAAGCIGVGNFPASQRDKTSRDGGLLTMAMIRHFVLSAPWWQQRLIWLFWVATSRLFNTNRAWMSWCFTFGDVVVFHRLVMPPATLQNVLRKCRVYKDHQLSELTTGHWLLYLVRFWQPYPIDERRVFFSKDWVDPLQQKNILSAFIKWIPNIATEVLLMCASLFLASWQWGFRGSYVFGGMHEQLLPIVRIFPKLTAGRCLLRDVCYTVIRIDINDMSCRCCIYVWSTHLFESNFQKLRLFYGLISNLGQDGYPPGN